MQLNMQVSLMMLPLIKTKLLLSKLFVIVLLISYSFYMDVNLIRNLEIKYHNLIWEIVGGNNFKDSLTEMQETMRRDHEEIAQNYFKTNVVEILFERITRYFIYRHNSINFKILTIHQLVQILHLRLTTQLYL